MKLKLKQDVRWKDKGYSISYYKLISDYYYANDMSKIKEWTYKVGIQGIDSYRNISQDRKNFVNLTKRKSKER